MVDLASHGPVAPSVLLLRDDGELLCGDAAQRRATAEPQRVAREFKRRLGDPTPIIVDRTPFAADALMATLLAWVADAVRKAEGGSPAAVAVTHPANWGDYKLDLLRQAVRGANLGNVSLVSEPEAAAIHYATQERIEAGSVVAVYDLGGGTFDAAVLRRTTSSAGLSDSSSAGPPESQWLCLGQPEGIERLGGIDVDEAVFRHVVETTGIADQLDADDPTLHAALHRLRQDCTAAKEALSADTDVSIPVMLPGSATLETFSQVRLTRAELEEMVGPTLRATIGALQRTVGSADMQPEDVHSVLLAGGSSRIPLVSQLLTTEFRRPLAVDAHPKHSVALGAALVAVHREGGGLDRAEATHADAGGPGPRQGVAPGALPPAFVVPIAPAATSSAHPCAVAVADPPEDPSDVRPETCGPGPDAAPAADSTHVYLASTSTSAEETPVDGQPTPAPVSRAGVLVATGALVLLAVLGVLLLRPGPSRDSGSETPSRAPAPAAAPNVTRDRSTTPGSQADHLLDQQREADTNGTTQSTDAGSGGGSGGGGGSSGSPTDDGNDGTQGNNSKPGGQSGPGTTTVVTSEPTTSTTARQPTVPSVVGKDVPAAETELQSAGFVATYDACPPGEPCVVTAQDPAGDARAPAGSRVQLTVGSAS